MHGPFPSHQGPHPRHHPPHPLQYHFFALVVPCLMCAPLHFEWTWDPVLLSLFVKNLIPVRLVSSVLGSPSLRQAQANSLQSQAVWN